MRALAETPRLVGGGRGLVTYAPMSVDQWLARHGGPREHLADPPDAPRPREVGAPAVPPDRGYDVFLAHPDREPKPRGRERLRTPGVGRG